MKKQFFRVKQLADQTFSRAEKTEVLTDDLQAADKHVEQIRAALTGLSKRLGTLSNPTQDPVHKEKRLKKCPEYILGQTMLENAAEDGLMSFTLAICGKAQVALANETVDHETKVEQYVAGPIHQILESNVPPIIKHKRNLAKLTLDMDSAKSRYLQACKSNAGGNSATKLDSLCDELKEAEVKVEQCRDQLAAEMFQLMSRETEIAQTIIQYIKLQRAYHESALFSLKELIPGLETYINDNEMKPVYGYPLEQHLRVTNRKIALPIQLCVSALLRLGMEEEGLFRIAPGASKLRRIKLSLDACCLTLPTALEYKDPHVIAGALKSYLRELPEPLLTFKLYSEWTAAAKITQSNDTRLRAFWEVLHKLPTANFENLKFLIKFLAVLTKNSDVNKMSPQNIAIVIAPNLIWSIEEDTNSMMININSANCSTLIVEQLITYADWFFPGDIDFDRDLDLSALNGGEQQTVGMRRCISNSSLSDLGDSPPHGSPKPITRRKNKPAPTPPGNTPNKQEKPDEKPPPVPDKPPKPLSTATLNRHTYKAQKHEVNMELTGPYSENKANKHRNSEPIDTNILEDNEKNVEIIPENANKQLKPKVSDLENHVINRSRQESADKSSPTTLERQKIPVAASRTVPNALPYHIDHQSVDQRNKKKPVPLDRNKLCQKPAIPERPPGLLLNKPSMHQVPNDNNNVESLGTSLEKVNINLGESQLPSSMENRGTNVDESQGKNITNLQRSPSVGSRPFSTVVGDAPNSNQDQELSDQTKSHSRTRSEGNIIDVQTQTGTVIVPKSPQSVTTTAGRFPQRLPRPQPPPPPLPVKKPNSESTNL